jgi:transposase-like protein
VLSTVKTIERERARALRAEDGLSIKEIARRVGVSTASVSVWVRDIELTEAQHEALHGQNAAYYRLHKGREIASAHRRNQRLQAQESGRALARRADPLHVAGCMLYWAEGTKNRNQIRFSNSDPEMVRFFVLFLRTYFDVRDQDVRLTCNLFADHVERQREIERHWLEVAGLPEICLCKSTVNVYSRYSQRKRRNMLPYGTCRVVLSRTSVVQSIYGAIQEYAGFERDAWLE